MSKPVHFAPVIAKATRMVQSLSPYDSIGIRTLSKFLYNHSSEFQGLVRLRSGFSMHIDTLNGFENTIFYMGDCDPPITHILKNHLRVGNYCIDVGANVGFYTLLFAQHIGTQGHVAAFEPNPVLKNRLLANVQLNHFENVEVIEKEIQVYDETQFYDAEIAAKLFEDTQDNSLIPSVNVDAIMLDTFILKENWPRLDIVKIDIEGNNCQAILGAKRCIERFHPLIVFRFNNTKIDPLIATLCFDFLSRTHYRFVGVSIRTGQHFTFNWRFVLTETPRDFHVLCYPAL